MGNRLFVGNLPWSANEEDLKSFFGGEALVEEIRIITDRETGKSKGFAFISMVSDAAAAEAINNHDGAVFGGRPLRVSEATERERRPSAPRGDSGGGGYGGGRGGGRGDDRGRNQRRGRDDDHW